MIYRCSKCENELKETDTFCSKCGGVIVKGHIGEKLCVEVVGINNAINIQYKHVIPVNKEQLLIANIFLQNIPQLHIEYNTENYTTLCYNDYDIVRVTNNSLYIFLSKKDREYYKEDDIFKKQINKKQLFWITPYDENKLNIYIELINNRLKEIK